MRERAWQLTECYGAIALKEDLQQARRGLSEATAAHYIGMSRSFLRQARMHGKRRNRTAGPPFSKIGRRILYLQDDLDGWLEFHRQPAE